eukprot:2914893-Rhodomonas_salina.1
MRVRSDAKSVPGFAKEVCRTIGDTTCGILAHVFECRHALPALVAPYAVSTELCSTIHCQY